VRGRVAFFLLLACVLAAHADWTAKGVFQYTDREINSSGQFNGTSLKPIREADVQVVDANTLSVLGQGITSATGYFEVGATDASTRDVTVVVLSSSDNSADLHISVKDPTSGNALYSMAAGTVSSHDPNTDHDFGTTVAPQASAGNPVAMAFSIYDNLLIGADFIKARTGSRPSPAQALSALWARTAGQSG